MSAYLGIDAGNTGVKVVLFDGEGRALASAHRDTGGHCPAPGMVERDIGRLRTDLDGLVREVLHKSGLKGSDVAGIGTSGHGNGLYLLDADGAPVAAIQSLDTRAAGLVEEWDDSGVADAVERICLQRPWAAQTPAPSGTFVVAADPRTTQRLVRPGDGAGAHEVAPELAEVEDVAAAAVGDAGGQPPQVVVERLAGGCGDEPLDGVDVEPARRSRVVPSTRRRSARQPARGSVTSSPVSRNVPTTSSPGGIPTCARCRSRASVWVPAQCRSSSTTSVGQCAAVSLSTAMKASYKR